LIVGISGKINSGKSTFSKRLVELGFHKFSFADWMKQYCANVYGVPVEWMYDQDAKESTAREYKISELCKDLRPFERMGYSAERCRELVLQLEKTLNRSHFISLREMLQYVGTEYFRALDPNFHVKRTVERLDHDLDYVCDDLRFPNEVEALKQVHATLYRINRPSHSDTGNHPSETALDDYTGWDRIITNDSTLENYNLAVDRMIKQLHE